MLLQPGVEAGLPVDHRYSQRRSLRDRSGFQVHGRRLEAALFRIDRERNYLKNGDGGVVRWCQEH